MNLLLLISFHHGARGQVKRLGRGLRPLSGGKRIGAKLLFCASPAREVKGIGHDFTCVFDENKAIKQLTTLVDWCEKVITSYEACEKPFWGVGTSYIERNDTKTYIDGAHLIGTGIYPPDAWTRVKGHAAIEKSVSALLVQPTTGQSLNLAFAVLNGTILNFFTLVAGNSGLEPNDYNSDFNNVSWIQLL